jgi:hypothetical protein
MRIFATLLYACLILSASARVGEPIQNMEAKLLKAGWTKFVSRMRDSGVYIAIYNNGKSSVQLLAVKDKVSSELYGEISYDAANKLLDSYMGQWESTSNKSGGIIYKSSYDRRWIAVFKDNAFIVTDRVADNIEAAHAKKFPDQKQAELKMFEGL